MEKWKFISHESHKRWKTHWQNLNEHDGVMDVD